MGARPRPAWTRVHASSTLTAQSATTKPKAAPVSSAGNPGGGWRDHLGSLAFLAPGAIFLLAITVYPLVATARNSFYDATATNYIGLGNYKEIFSTSSILVTFRNNVIWVLVFPFLVTFIGLVYGVLSERIRWSTAFKTIVFSATASALVWRTIFDLDPHIGIVNAAIQTASDWVNPPGLYPIDTSAGQTVAALAATGVSPGPNDSLQSSSTVTAGNSIELGLIGVSPATLQLAGAQTAVAPTASSGAVTGLVWRDFSPSNPTARGQVLPDEFGFPGLKLTLLNSNGSSAGTAVTDAHGDFSFGGVGSGSYKIQIDPSNFGSGFTGIF